MVVAKNLGPRQAKGDRWRSEHDRSGKAASAQQGGAAQTSRQPPPKDSLALRVEKREPGKPTWLVPAQQPVLLHVTLLSGSSAEKQPAGWKPSTTSRMVAYGNYCCSQKPPFA